MSKGEGVKLSVRDARFAYTKATSAPGFPVPAIGYTAMIAALPMRCQGTKAPGLATKSYCPDGEAEVPVFSSAGLVHCPHTQLVNVYCFCGLREMTVSA